TTRATGRPRWSRPPPGLRAANSGPADRRDGRAAGADRGGAASRAVPPGGLDSRQLVLVERAGRLGRGALVGPSPGPRLGRGALGAPGPRVAVRSRPLAPRVSARGPGRHDARASRPRHPPDSHDPLTRAMASGAPPDPPERSFRAWRRRART